MATSPAASFPPDDEPLVELPGLDAREPDAGVDVADHAKPRVAESFWQKPWVQEVLPLITSIVLHLAIVVLMIVLIPPTIKALRQVTQEQVLIPDASFAEGNEPGGIPNPGLGN